MTRLIISSQNIADTATSVQLKSVDDPHMFAITMKARAGNTGGIYIGDDSAAKSSGFELLAGDREDWTFHPTETKPTVLWVWGNSSGDRLDYTIAMVT